MIELCLSAGFEAKSRQRLRLFRQFRFEEFQGDGAVQFAVVRAVDVTHAARTERLLVDLEPVPRVLPVGLDSRKFIGIAVVKLRSRGRIRSVRRQVTEACGRILLIRQLSSRCYSVADIVWG